MSFHRLPIIKYIEQGRVTTSLTVRTVLYNLISKIIAVCIALDSDIEDRHTTVNHFIADIMPA